MFKNCFETETYVKQHLPFHYRRAMALFRCGVAPIRLETGRYENLSIHERTCFNCTDTVEDEIHVMLHCPLYLQFREDLFESARTIVNNFDNLSDVEKMHNVFVNPFLTKFTAKACFNILKHRRLLLYCR
jgi:hypothetical protein